MVIPSLILTAVILFFPVEFSKAQKEASAAAELLYPPGAELTVGVAVPDPLRAYDQFADLKSYATAPIQQTEGCKSLETWEPVIVSRTHWRSIVPLKITDSDVGVLAIAADVNCVKLGQPAHIAHLDAKTGIMTTRGWFLPTGITLSRPEFYSQEDRLRISAGLLGSKRPVAFVSGRVIARKRSDVDRSYAPRMLGVRMITRRQMESAIQAGTQIVDVRSKKQFAAAHVKGAVHVPYTVGPRMKMFDDYAGYVKAGDAFDIRRINQDRQKPVILMGDGPYSDNVYRAAVVLRSEGWKQIFIFYEGFNYFAGMMWKPPDASGIVEVMDWPLALFELIRNERVNVIDVRSAAEFAEGSIKRAISVPLKERDDLRLHRPGLNGQMLLQYGDTWDPGTLNKNVPLILFGNDENDWRSYKTAIMARAMGFRRVYWFRLGYDAWTSTADERRSQFQIQITRSGGNQ